MMKYLAIGFLFFCMYKTGLAQEEQHLSISQIIDSAKQKNPILRKNLMKANYPEKNSWNFAPLEVSYQKGNLYSAANDYSIEFRQELGSPFIKSSKYKLSHIETEYNEAERELQEKLIISEIKKAYFNVQFYLELQKLYQLKYELYLKMYNLFLLDDSLGIKKFDKLIISTALAEADINNRTSYNHRIKAQNMLLQASFLENETLPADSVFEIYEIIPSSDKESRTPAHLFNNLWEIKHKQAQQQYKYNKMQLTPTFFAGYGINTINQQKGFNYWMIGVQIPILAFSQVSDLKKAKMQKEVAELELFEKRSENDAVTANLLTDLNLYFERLNYFYDIALQQSQDLLDMADEQLESSNYSAEKLIWTIEKAFSIRQDYIQNILNYNLKAAELELYAY